MSRADGANTFEIATECKTYYLTADSQPLMEDWVRVLQNVVQRNALKLLLSREDGISPTLQVCIVAIDTFQQLPYPGPCLYVCTYVYVAQCNRQNFFLKLQIKGISLSYLT